MRKMMQRSLSCLLTLAMVVTMLMTSTLAAEKSAKLEFDYSANYDSSKVVSLEVYKGYPADSYAKEEEIFSQLEAITPQADGSYVVTAPGTYAYHVHGTGYYNILQLFKRDRGRPHRRREEASVNRRQARRQRLRADHQAGEGPRLL